MVEINLLPWREEKQQYELRLMKRALTSGCVVMIILWFCIHMWMAWQVNRASQHVRQLRASMPAAQHVDTEETKDNEREFVYGADIVSLLNASSRAAASGVCYQRIARENGGIIFAGNASSLQSLTVSQRRLQASEVFSQVKMMDFKKDSLLNNFQFSAHARLLSKMEGAS